MLGLFFPCGVIDFILGTKYAWDRKISPDIISGKELAAE